MYEKQGIQLKKDNCEITILQPSTEGCFVVGQIAVTL